MADIEQLRRNVARLEAELAADAEQINDKLMLLKIAGDEAMAAAEREAELAIKSFAASGDASAERGAALVMIAELKAKIPFLDSVIEAGAEASTAHRANAEAAKAKLPGLRRDYLDLAARLYRASVTRKRTQLEKHRVRLAAAEASVASKLEEKAEAAVRAEMSAVADAEMTEKAKRLAAQASITPGHVGPIMHSYLNHVAKKAAGAKG